jgi:hypothetical protein
MALVGAAFAGLIASDAHAQVQPLTQAHADVRGRPSRMIFVHVGSPFPVVLQHKGAKADDDDFSDVCTSPCDTYLDPAGEYRIAPSPSLRASASFSLRTDLPVDVVAVDPASQRTFHTGIGLTVVGGVLAGAATAWWVASLVSSFQGQWQGQDATGPEVFDIAGAAVALCGAFIIATSARTGASQGDLGDDGSGSVDEATISTSPSLREEAWREAPSEPRALARSVDIPLLRVAF